MNDFDTLVAEINKRVELGYINTKFHKNYPSLQLFNYSDSCTYEEKWDEFTEMARGLIICNEERRIVARPFKKFHNYGTKFAYTPKEDEAFEVFEKLDGSLIIIFEYKNQWLIATRGSFHSDQAVWAKNWLDTNTPWPVKDYPNRFSDCRTEYTYLCEAIYAGNRIVINYGDREELVLLSVIHTESGKEIDDLDTFLDTWAVAKIYSPNSFQELLEHTKNLPGNEEGYVVRYASGNRIKIKGDEYCRIHRLI